MPEKRISHVVGKGSLAHNNRTFFAKNVDRSRSPQNAVIVKISIADAYQNLFGAAVDRYNEKQTRKCRRIQPDYFFHLFNHKICDYTLVANNKQKSFYEDLVQVGDMHDTGCGSPDAETAKLCLQEYFEHYIKNNPNFYVFNAVIHMDEATPHLHINYIPVGHFDKGLDTRNAMAKALEEMGYTGANAATKWREHEREVFTEICRSHGLEIAAPGKSRGYNFTVDEYKEIQEEKKRLTEELQPLREMELAADESVIVGKKQLLSSNISVSPEELTLLETQKKAAAVQSLDNQRERDSIERCRQSLDTREDEIHKSELAIKIEKERISNMLSAVEDKEQSANSLLQEAERKNHSAEIKYNEQLELNKNYTALSRELREVKRENDDNLSRLAQIRRAVGIPFSDDKTDTLERCKELAQENYAIKTELNRELNLPYQKFSSISALEMCRTVLDNFRRHIAKVDRENEESRTLITSLKEQLSTIKQEFTKVVLALNTLIFTKEYSKGLTGISKALANGISLFADNCFKKRGEYESIDKSVLDSEIKENMELFIKPEYTKDKTYYTR